MDFSELCRSRFNSVRSVCTSAPGVPRRRATIASTMATATAMAAMVSSMISDPSVHPRGGGEAGALDAVKFLLGGRTKIAVGAGAALHRSRTGVEDACRDVLRYIPHPLFRHAQLLGGAGGLHCHIGFEVIENEHLWIKVPGPLSGKSVQRKLK